MWIKYLTYRYNRKIKKLTLNKTNLTSNIKIKHAQAKPKDITNEINKLKIIINCLRFQKE